MTAHLDNILAFLKELDEQCKFNHPVDLYLIGGGAITLAYDPQNRTADLDFIDPPDNIARKGNENSELAKKYHVYISSLPEIVFSVPGDWRSKSKKLSLKLKNLCVFIPCVEDIVLGKLSRMEPKDFEDIIAITQRKLLNPKSLLERLKQNLKEFKKTEYRNNALLLFNEIFGLKLSFGQGTLKLSKR
ncbi:MAG: hypothetical protein HYU97_04185 [Deltaproteobacteria bacterium]|nr:hypothetical protein [Deltaproteobacteria bacterium]